MGTYGITSAANTFVDMKRTFTSLEFGLMVGIGGGVPSKTDVRLGDVVVCRPSAGESGVIQYDFGKMLSTGAFQRTGYLNEPPRLLLNALNHIESEYKIGNGSIGQIIADVLDRNEFMRKEFSRPEDDWLFDAAYDHQGCGESCHACDMAQLVHRKPRGSDNPSIHYGLIASGNSLLRDAVSRDRMLERTISCASKWRLQA
ncbi:nucleoside phosphorylase domain-containing protein [Penicillium maclennaniae]|uniref:nucleoside phosphorylase domain-containing protein n=1 Tax=Penicillium maclennaniae TaxID=1343394 RepID=UPI00254034A9|nr:nucleoside phosphorylase domain-containing protein [Penicillium maclennaniae]KAJ5667781.1 nucleoside phosphorylase domain-containing protein [Penicillium maclennaniae]